MHYPINEIFQTIQGEGYYTGTPSIFIRLQGCPVHCHWCDTKYTWVCSDKENVSIKEVINKNQVSKKWSYLTINDILETLKKWTAKHVVISGGEPCLYNLLYITKILEKKGYQCQIETSGIKNIICSLNTWVTLSPKKNIRPLNESIIRSNEIKFPILKKEDLLYVYDILSNIKDKKKRIIYLQPISQNKKALNICMNICMKKNWKLSVQLHKYINIQ
ncbi:7-carboxy-7-deazaguanine synthase QueE [Buchnera aphidicola (Aphis craccivora)]|uniref:7-carboxy-7-deazaguanine synthase n=2 Tax=cellular organisms TaxID=131567 RepID=A0A6G0VV82_APHCR|nr:7-carboxy-7-deazaguanine synthase QueE [Buchnera aphidicola]KAF0707759.1 7-carboxy-7-deazaguanine synthase [Aphis craccivora]QCI16650.1 7-carboxy-7-deazaguanine synthase QueE [Buchnera aphidicola (Aphis craccivora)]QLL40782.1 7-carboxy-7-deazaguanine synthase QueE [Buchnera aphidicola (Aphis craccivore)]WAI17622.1 MAG: 7-carboxy-7-deazaguanine synthase QueE [Buchnera aphidicola (Aphis craccivora)]